MKTIIVRLAPGSRAEAINAPLGTLAAGPADEELASVARSRPEVSVADISEGERASLEASREHLVARPMPLKLIEPVPRGDDEEGESDHSDYVDDDGAGGRAAWGLVATRAVGSPFSGQGVPVAVLDSGIDENHPAFADPALIIVKRNFTDEGTEDVIGHGTHCAGTIFGRDVGGIRIGVARGVTRAYVAKVIPGDSADLIDALNWAHGSGARVASMSVGYNFAEWIEKLVLEGYPREAVTSIALRDFRQNILTFDTLVANFRARSLDGGGMVVIAASGNESKRDWEPSYTVGASSPSASLGVVAVGAVGRSAAGLGVAPFSNTHAQICAPGVDVLSALFGSDRLYADSGTSMACPHVAGLAALRWEAALQQGGNAVNAERIVNRLIGQASTEPLEPGFSDFDVGEGLAVAPA